MKQWYEALFENYAESYDRETFTRGTLGECDFIEAELSADKSKRIVDIGCGTGRHSIELAKRGYKITGVDLSVSMLERARQKAGEAGVQITFLQHDARKLPFEGNFDVALMLCEGGFPLMETDEMNFEILRNVRRALVPGRKLIFTTLNGLFPLFNSVEQFCAAESSNDNAAYRQNSFNLMTFRDHNITEIVDDNGNKQILDCNERYYVPSEITWLLKSLDFVSIDIFAKPGLVSSPDSMF
jgi:ubiquinone/menaquinone biosynthesis C-methylase UbiE